MDVKVIVRNCEVKDFEQKYILDKIENLSRFGLELKNVSITIKKEGFNYILELFLSTLFKNFLISKKGEKVAEVIDIIVEKMAVTLIKHKNKVKDHQNKKINFESEKLISKKKIIYENIDSLDRLLTSEAIKILEESKENFLVYRDIYTDAMMVAIKNDDEIKIIEG